MVVYRDLTTFRDDDMYDLLAIDLVKKPGKGLGLSIVGRQCNTGILISDIVSLCQAVLHTSVRPTLQIYDTTDGIGRAGSFYMMSIKIYPFIYVTIILQVKGGVAESDGRLIPGDHILTVNGEDVREVTQEYGAELLKVNAPQLAVILAVTNFYIFNLDACM